MKRLADELLGNVGSVGIGRVDEGHSQLWQSSQRAERLLPVGRLAPYALAGDPHRAEAEAVDLDIAADPEGRSEEHTSELQSLMRISYAVFCLKKKTHNTHHVHLIRSSTHTTT